MAVSINNNIRMIPVSRLLPHEQVSSSRLFEVLEEIRRESSVYPLLVDGSTGVLLDGHHRLQSLIELGFSVAPCQLLDYHTDVSLTVTAWREDEEITKEDVLEAGLSRRLMPPKTSKHRFPRWDLEKVPLQAVVANEDSRSEIVNSISINLERPAWG